MTLRLRMMNEKPLINNNGWASFDPVDSGLLEGLSKKDIREREERLMQAVLENAIEYFQKYVLAEDEKGKKLFQEEEEWILEKNSDWLFSFENICEALRLDPNYIRQGLLSWKEAQRKFHSKAVNNHNRRRCYGRKTA